MKFLKSWSIDLEKLPTYAAFKKPFTIEVDKALLCKIYNSRNEVFTNERKTLLHPIINAIKNDTLIVKHNQRYNIGRFYADNSISPICVARHIKHTLFKHLGWVDLDMVKGHPTILYNIAKNNGLELEYFKKYLDNPSYIFEELIKYYSVENETPLTDDNVKDIFNIAIYGGGHNTWLRQMEHEQIQIANTIPHPFVSCFIKECKNIIDIVYLNNPKLVEKVKGNLTDEYSIKTRAMSYWCQSIENHIIFICFNFLKKRELIKNNNILLEYDGLCLKLTNNDPDFMDSILTEMNDLILKETGLLVKMKWKEYNNKHIHLEELDEEEFTEEEEECDTENKILKNEDIPDGVFNDLDAAELVYKLYPHWVYCNGKLYAYDSDNGLWNYDKSIHYKIISALSDKLHVLIDNGKKGIIQSDKSYGNTLSLMTKIPPLIETMCKNDDWITNAQYSSLGKILFNNGYYDFKQSTFFPKTEYGFTTPEIVFMDKIYRDYNVPTEDDIKYIETIKQRFFYDPLNEEMGDYLCLNIARGLAGDKMKRIVFGLGDSNCGKSVLTTAIKMSCGGYFGSFNAENLAYRKSSADEAQIMRWCKNLRYKRLIFSNEVKSTTFLNGNMIKKISSGGDAIVGRGHGENEEEFITHFLAFVMANDLPKIKPYDNAVNNRTKVFSYKKVFVENPSNEFELLMDKNIEKEILTQRFQDCFIQLLMYSYKEYMDMGCKDIEPEEVILSKDEWIEEQASVIDIFKNDFEITNDAKDYIESSIISDWLINKKLGITITKFGFEMNKYIKIQGLENVLSKDKKIGGKTKKVWFGIKNCDDDDATSTFFNLKK